MPTITSAGTVGLCPAERHRRLRRRSFRTDGNTAPRRHTARQDGAGGIVRGDRVLWLFRTFGEVGAHIGLCYRLCQLPCPVVAGGVPQDCPGPLHGRGHAAVTPEKLFFRACHLYPRMFVALVSTPQSGVWLTATPEILLDGEPSHMRTIALAGTMRLEGDQLNGEGENVSWSTKNIEEQRIVATYVAECLEHFADSFNEEGPRTVRAANLVHLRSDFTFTLPDSRHLGDLIGSLHPTPAVCGLPKRDAFQFIIRNENHPRRYYSGFMGWLDPQGDTHLYVSLRCMNIDGANCHLYAGGGLLRDSVMEQEWLETEAKLETMRRLLSS